MYRPPQTQRPSRRDTAMEQYAQLQQLQNQSSATDSQSQAALMQQLMEMYKLPETAARMELAKSELGIRQSELGLKEKMAPSQISLSEAQAKYEQAIAAGYPASEAARIASQQAGTEQTRQQTKGLAQQQEAFPARNAAELALQGAQTGHLTEQTKGLGIENQYAPDKALAQIGILQGQAGTYPFQQQHLQLENDALRGQNSMIPEQLRNLQLHNTGLEGQNSEIPAHLRGMELANFAQALQNNALPEHLRLQNATSQSGLDTAALQQDALRQQNAWYDTNQQQQYAEHAFDQNFMNPMKLKLGQEQIDSAHAHTALGFYGAGGLTLPQAQKEGMPSFYGSDLKPVYDAQEKARQAAIAQDQAQQTGTPTPTMGNDLMGNIGGGVGTGLRYLTSPITFPFRAAGAGWDAPVDRTIPDIPFVPPKGDFWDYKQRKNAPKIKP